MEKLKILLLLILFITACQDMAPSNPEVEIPKGIKIPEGINKLAECTHNFAVNVLRSVEYIECDKGDLLQDFEDYQNWLEELAEEGELWREAIIYSVPEDLKRTERVFCSRGCSATHFLEGQCFIWESAQRKRMQDIEKRAEEEESRKPYCGIVYADLTEKTKELNAGENLNYDWKATDKYKNWIEGKGEHETRGETIWESL